LDFFRLTHDFGQKCEIPSMFVLYLIFLGTISLEMVFGNVLDRKQGFLDYKNAWNFFKGVSP